MTQLYFKFVNHVNNINGVPTFSRLKSSLDIYKNDKGGSHIINGLWYDLNDYYKKANGHDINDNKSTSSLNLLYWFTGTSSDYTLPIAYLSVYDTQEQADNYDVNNAKYSLYKLIYQTYTEKPNYGQIIRLTSLYGSQNLKLGDDKTYYMRVDIGNPTDPVYNYPFVDYQHQPFNCYKDNNKPHIYDEINDITCTVPNSLYGIIYKGNSTTDVSFDINLNGKTSVMKFNTNNKVYNTNSLNYNEYFIILPHDNSKQVPIILTLTNCKSDISSLPENTEEEIKNNHVIEKTITLTASEGYIFDKDITYYSYDINDAVYIKETAKATNKNTISFSMIAGAYDDLQNQAQKPEIIAIANPENEDTSKEDTSTGLDSIHIYHMKNDELNNLSNKLITTYKSTSSGDPVIQTYDYTRFINQVYRLPFSISPNIEVDTTIVSTGMYNLNINTKTLKVDHYDIDIGTIKIDSKDANSYNAIKATLYLPFINSIQLDINDIIGHTISITYRINLLNGMNTVIIENENGLIYNQNVNVATNLQLFGAYYDKNVGSLNSVLNNNLRQAYIVIERKAPITNLLTYPTNEHGVVSDYKGLTKFANTQLHLNVTYQEKQEILSQLQQGVIIK